MARDVKIKGGDAFSGLYGFKNNDNLAVAAILDDLYREVCEAGDDIIKTVANETLQVVRDSARSQGLSDKYVYAIRKRATTLKDYRRTGAYYRIHNTGKYASTGHLVENAHFTPIKSGKYGNKVKTRAFPHFTAGAEYADKRIEELADRIIEEKIAKWF